MAHHAYFVVGETEEGIARALAFVSNEFGLAPIANPDVMTLRHGLLSVEDARRLRSLAELSPTVGERKVLIISASRFFHEAQNALLKLFEEPPAGTVLILVIPAEGVLLATLRSRLLALPDVHTNNSVPAQRSPGIQEFLAAKKTEREKILAKIIDRTKSDKEEEKQHARMAAIHLLEGLTRAAHDAWLTEKNPSKQKELQTFLDDLAVFLPILHERSAPRKLIFEHLMLVMPAFI